MLAERIHSLAKARQWSVNEVLLHALRKGMDISTVQPFSESLLDPHALTEIGSDWEANEKGVFQEALRALTQRSATQFAPENIRVAESAPGAE
ncbi:hypothetical protein [Rhodanobacter sp. B04]|uniref:hypothetical protein n=1 Tax=Rhodanobacter sp. B04 TaxID=1945860 RepID=UPI0020C2D3D7|nr:hypothetical protein [Rhodanobacter sp. B04]